MPTQIKRIVVPTVAIGVLLIIVVWMSGAFRDRIEPGLNSASIATMEGGAELLLEEHTVPAFESVPATISARDATNISARTVARIEEIKVRSGDMVSQGQLLVQLEQSDLSSRVAQAKEQVNTIVVRLDEARKNLSRAQELRGKGLLAIADFDKAQANVDALKTQHAFAQQALEEAKTRLSYSEIRTPIDGRVVDRFAEPGDTASPGMTLLSIYNPQSLRVEARVREQLALQLAIGQQLEVNVPALDIVETAEIDELVPAADAGSRSFLVKARMALDEQLLPGMYATVRIPAGERVQLMVPMAAVTTLGQLHRVEVIHEGIVERRFVRLGQANKVGDRVVISGLEAGDVMFVPQ